MRRIAFNIQHHYTLCSLCITSPIFLAFPRVETASDSLIQYEPCWLNFYVWGMYDFNRLAFGFFYYLLIFHSLNLLKNKCLFYYRVYVCVVRSRINKKNRPLNFYFTYFHEFGKYTIISCLIDDVSKNREILQCVNST